MSKVKKKSSIVNVCDVSGRYVRSELNPSIFIHEFNGIELLLKDTPGYKAVLKPAAQLLVRGEGEVSFSHLSGLWKVSPGRNEFRISDNTKGKPKGIAIVTWDMFGMNVVCQNTTA
jgi:hypothetical protein